MRKLGVLVAILMLVLSLGTAQAQIDNDTIIVGIHADIQNLDPHNFRHRETETVLRNIYDGLVTRGPDMQPVPELAETVTQIDDTTWEFTLRQGVKFHDGTEMTAEDVAFSINRYVGEGAMAGQTSPRKDLLGPVTHAEAVDTYTVRVYMSSPWSVFLPHLVHHMIVPKSVGDGLVEHPIGTGPFKFVERVPGSHIVLERFDDYYGGAPDLGRSGPAPARRIIFQIMPETATRLAALRAGEIDIMTEVPVHALQDIEQHPDLLLRPVAGTRSYFTEFNVNKAPFDDVRVRQALNYAVDVDTIIDAFLDGLGEPLTTILSPLSFGHNDDLQPYPYDPERARQLLAEAGYPNGFSTSVAVLNSGYTPDMFAVIQANFKDVGINLRIDLQDPPTWGETLMTGNAPLAVLLHTSTNPDHLLTRFFYGPSCVPDGSNFACWDGADDLIVAARSELDDEKRLEMYKEIQRRLAEDVPLIPVLSNMQIDIVSNRVKNYVKGLIFDADLRDVYLEGR